MYFFYAIFLNPFLENKDCMYLLQSILASKNQIFDGDHVQTLKMEQTSKLLLGLAGTVQGRWLPGVNLTSHDAKTSPKSGRE